MNNDFLDGMPAFPRALCGVCEEPCDTTVACILDETFGRVCTTCGALHLPRAIVALARTPGICGELRTSKNNHPSHPSH